MTRFGGALVAIFLLALAIRLGVTWKYQGLTSPPRKEANPDQIEYEEFAAQLAAGNGYSFADGTPTACRPPGTSFILAPIYSVFGHSYLAGRLWFCLLSSLTVLGAGWLGYLLFGKREAIVGSFLLAIYPGHFYYSMHFLSETPFALFLTLACGFGIVAARKRPGWADMVSGLAWGFTILIRPNMILGLGLRALIVLWYGPWKDRLVHWCLLVGCAGSVVAPWVVRNSAVMGKPTICTIVGGFTFWGAHNEVIASKPELMGYWVSATSLRDFRHPLRGSEVEREEAAYRYGWEFIRNHPDTLPQICFHKVARLIWVYNETSNETMDTVFRISWLCLLPFVLLGLVVAIRRRTPQLEIILVPFVATFLTAIVFYGCSRFRDGVAPILVIFAAVGIGKVLDRFQRRICANSVSMRHIGAL
jgi:4-amino-4-deoxy-L-arabinose transferase-like glycosyltransferase